MRTPLGRTRAEKLDVFDQRLHLRAGIGQALAVHAPVHAAIDALFERKHLIVGQHGKCGEGRDEGGGKGPQSGVQMAVDASQVVACVALLGIGRVLADMLCRIDDSPGGS